MSKFHCGTWCFEGHLCRCCLEAEVERLRVQHDEIVARLTDDLAKANAAIQRVRGLAQTWDGMAHRLVAQGVRVDLDPAHVAGEIKRALDRPITGGSE